MAALPKVGRYLYAVPFLVFGLFHFMNAPMMAGYVPIPGGVLWVYLTGVAFLAASAAIMTGKYAQLACQLLGLMLLIFVVSVHLVGVISAADEMARNTSMTQLLKDTALAGAAWALSGVFAEEAGDAGAARQEPQPSTS